MGMGHWCVYFPLKREKCDPAEFLGYLEKLGFSPMWSRGCKVGYDPVLGSLEETDEYFEANDCRTAIELLQNEDFRFVFHNENEKAILHVGAATEPTYGRFALHSTSGRSEKEALQAWMQKCGVSMPDLCAAFARSVGARSFSFESVERAIGSVKGEIDREDFEDGSGDFKSYPLGFAGLPDESTDYFTDYVKRKLSVSQSYVTVKTSIGDVYCLALGKDHVQGAECTLSGGMGKVKFVGDD
jgi:hypothetical protein